MQMQIGQDNPDTFKIKEEQLGEGKQPCAIYALWGTISGQLQRKRMPFALSNLSITAQQKKVSSIPEHDNHKNVIQEDLPSNETTEIQTLEATKELIEDSPIDISYNQISTSVRSSLDWLEMKLFYCRELYQGRKGLKSI